MGVQYRIFGKTRELKRPVKWGFLGSRLLLRTWISRFWQAGFVFKFKFGVYFSPGGKNPDLCTLLQKGGGGNRRPFCRRMVVKAFHAHTHNMQESQDNAADSASLMKITGWTVPSLFSLWWEKSTCLHDDFVILCFIDACYNLWYYFYIKAWLCSTTIL